MQQPGQHPQYEYQPVYQQPHSPQFVDQQQPLQQQYADQQQHNQQYFDQQQYGQQQYVGQQHGVNQQQYPQRQRPLEPSQSPLPEVVPPQHAYYNQGHNAPEVVVADYPQTVYQADKPGSVPLPQYYGRVPPPAGQEKRICGLSRRLFIILATVIVVLVVGAVVGGAVGGTVGKKGSSGGGGGSDSVAATTTATSAPTTTPTPVPTNPAALLGNSSISSANYTDARGFSHSLVFWQSASAKLLVSSWDGENRTWQTTSISAKLEGSGITLSFLVGTPIAATAYLETSGPKIRLYALTSTSTIIELYNDDITTASQGNWKQGSLGTQAILKAGAGSQLAVHHPPCAGPGSCMTQTFLLYQDSSQAVKICWFPWQPSTLALANNGTGLAATNVYGLVNGAPNYTDPGLRLYYDSSGIIQEAIIGLDLSVYFYGSTLGPAPAPSPTYAKNWAAVNFGGTYFLLLVSVRDSDSTLAARYWNNVTWAQDLTPSFGVGWPSNVGANPKFQAVALNQEKRAYGIVDGAVYEWEFADATPLQWTYSGIVNTTLVE